MSNPDSLVYTVPEAAKLLSISTAAAYAAAKRGDIPAMRFGNLIKVPKAALHALVNGVERNSDSGDHPPASDLLPSSPPIIVQPSLKGLLPKLVPIFDMTEDALYERQRELVRIGQLAKPEGRGPNSGTPANADTVSIFVSALLMTDRIRDLKSFSENEFLTVAQKVKDAMADGVPLSHVRNDRAKLVITMTISAGAIGEIGKLAGLPPISRDQATLEKPSQTLEVP